MSMSGTGMCLSIICLRQEKIITGPLFKSYELGNYQLLQLFPGSAAAIRIPEEIARVLGIQKSQPIQLGLSTGSLNLSCFLI
jgi:hypothetical protein